MKKTLKKGFTIVELVIVIAVVAILAAVLIPTFVSVVNKANVSNDTALVRNINTVLATEEVTEGKPATMHDALKMAENGGFDVSKLTPRSTGDIVWDSETNRFALVDGDKTVYSDGNKQITLSTKIWKIVDSETAAESATDYSVYLKDNATIADNVFTVKTGLDLGNNNVNSVKYENTNSAKNVVIRTNSFNTNLSVNAPQDTVMHYGIANNVKIDAVADSSYDELGRANVIEVKDGHVVLTENAVVEKVVAANTANTDKVSIKTFIDVQIEKAESAVIENLAVEAANESTVYVSDNSLKDKVTGKAASATEVGTIAALEQVFANGGFVKLTADITGTEGTSFVVAEGKTVYVDLNGYNITNAVVKQPAIINNGNLTFTGNGTVLNGNQTTGYAGTNKDGNDVYNANGSHVILNNDKGYLHIINGTFGSNENVGNAVRNYGNCFIDGGTFAAVKNGTGKGYAYVFANGSVNQSEVLHTGIMVINNATVTDSKANGMFAADAGEIIINGGNYKLTGDNTWYMFYIVSKDTTKLAVNGGEFIRTGANRFFGFSELNNTMASNEIFINVAKNYNIFINGGRLVNGADVLFENN